jgi:hypothetical protein
MNIEVLKVSQEYVVKTQFNPEGYPNLVFTGFYKENDDVTLACFDDVQQGFESFFDVSIPDNVVELAINELQQK